MQGSLYVRIAVRFGCCVTPVLIETAAAAGYDYVELPFASVMPERPEPEFEPARRALRSAPLRPEAWRLLLPPDLRVIGPNVDWPRVARYVYTALGRIADVGGTVICFGCAEERRVPKGFSVEEARDQIVEFLRVCGASARTRGLVVAVEPLSARSCDVINSLPEAVGLAKAVNMPEIGVLPDAHEMALDGHSPLDVVDAAAWLAHVHVPGDDGLPVSGEWTREFAHALRMADYDWRISIEADWRDPKMELPAALEFARSRFGASGPS